MREKVKHYQGNEITSEVIRKMNLIELTRQREGLTTFSIENINNLLELCDYHDTDPEQENIIIGEDWYLMYTIYNGELEIQEWISINNVKDKLVQSMEMFNSIKKVLLENKESIVYSTLRHSTSYRFYRLLLEKGYINEIDNNIDISDDIPEDLLSLVENRGNSSIEEYLDTECEEVLDDLPDFVFHNVEFMVSDKFVDRYNKR